MSDALLVPDTPEGIRVYLIQNTGTYVVADAAGWLPGEFDTVKDAVEYAEEVDK